MTLARTEHGLAVINGIPTVVGGVAEDEFLASVEQLDSSNDEDIAYQRQWRLVAQVRPLGFSLISLTVNTTSRLFLFQDMTSVWLRYQPAKSTEISSANLLSNISVLHYNFTIPRLENFRCKTKEPLFTITTIFYQPYNIPILY